MVDRIEEVECDDGMVDRIEEVEWNDGMVDGIEEVECDGMVDGIEEVECDGGMVDGIEEVEYDDGMVDGIEEVECDDGMVDGIEEPSRSRIMRSDLFTTGSLIGPFIGINSVNTDVTLRIPDSSTIQQVDVHVINHQVNQVKWLNLDME
ncbi:hypothetical protein M8J75_008906 [Diaphorina citri]|nr:hypothetical protein M8J75_008906 [Diaphorina citri]